MGAGINDMSPPHSKSGGHGCPQPPESAVKPGGVNRIDRKLAVELISTPILGFSVDACARKNNSVVPVSAITSDQEAYT
jgi:hypothetical protein